MEEPTVEPLPPNNTTRAMIPELNLFVYIPKTNLSTSSGVAHVMIPPVMICETPRAALSIQVSQ